MQNINRRLLLVRHAEAESPGAATGDRARQLTSKGRHDAHALGAYLRNNDISPDIALCSPAIRTRQTLHGVLESVAIPYREYPDGLYDASAGHLLEWIAGVENRHDTLLVISHNPGIQMLARSLAGTLSLSGKMLSYAPGTISIFGNSAERWEDLCSTYNRLLLNSGPEDYRNPSVSSSEASAS